MLGGYLEFFMKPDLAATYLALKRELNELIQMKVNAFFIHVKVIGIIQMLPDPHV